MAAFRDQHMENKRYSNSVDSVIGTVLKVQFRINRQEYAEKDSYE